MNTATLTKTLRLAKLELGAIERNKPPKKRPGLQALAKLWKDPDFAISVSFLESSEEMIGCGRAIIKSRGRKVADRTWPFPESHNKRKSVEALAKGSAGDRETHLLAKWFFNDLERSMVSYRTAEAFLASPAARQIERMVRARA